MKNFRAFHRPLYVPQFLYVHRPSEFHRPLKIRLSHPHPRVLEVLQALAYRKGLDPSLTIQICSACHRQIHTLYDNSHLALHLNTLEKLKQDPPLQKFLSWVRKQDQNKRVKMDRKR